MTTQEASTDTKKKPIPLRIIFILNGLMMILPFVFYTVFTVKDITIGDLDPIRMVYTGIGYILSFAAMVFFILKRKLLAIRIIIGLNILIALPAGAYIGILIALISFGLTFHGKVKAYFEDSDS